VGKNTESNRAKRHQPYLNRLCKHLYKVGGHPDGIRTIAGMVSVMAEKRLTKAEAWIWLERKYQDGAYVGIPDGESVKPRVPKPKKIIAPKIARIPAKDFYWSDEWRALRYRRLKASDGCCCLCGRSHRAHGVILHVDHIKPRSKHPELELVFDNTQVLCEDCNLGKSNRCARDWR
jgi:hypothetical protein